MEKRLSQGMRQHFDYATTLSLSIFERCNADDIAAIMRSMVAIDSMASIRHKKTRKEIDIDLNTILNQFVVSNEVETIIQTVIDSKSFEQAIQTGLNRVPDKPLLLVPICAIASEYYTIPIDLSKRCLISIPYEYREILSNFLRFYRGEYTPPKYRMF